MANRSPEPDPDEPPPGTPLWLLLIVAVVLLGGGYWLVLKIADTTRVQDCIESGRRDCVPGTPLQRSQ